MKTPPSLATARAADVELGPVRQAQEHAVAAADAEPAERRGEAVAEGVELGVGEGARLAGGVLPEQGGLVAAARLHLAARQRDAEVVVFGDEAPRVPGARSELRSNPSDIEPSLVEAMRRGIGLLTGAGAVVSKPRPQPPTGTRQAGGDRSGCLVVRLFPSRQRCEPRAPVACSCGCREPLASVSCASRSSPVPRRGPAPCRRSGRGDRVPQLRQPAPVLRADAAPPAPRGRSTARASASTCASTRSAPGRSALWITTTSATSSRPAFSHCRSSPVSGCSSSTSDVDQARAPPCRPARRRPSRSAPRRSRTPPAAATSAARCAASAPARRRRPGCG